ncbi:DUF5803 family protein [Natronobiforma cellulositropha]|uniref:DUF5803 family protein n=1 Tax=Natronobiforma cellulositropha TaxID=1679076 RepID=UPI0021D5D392|nr:DUF5803 family protein [Natronobiforma cellulositropha]
MNRRLLLATVLVALVAITAGCAGIFGGISDETLDREQEYDDLLDREADAVIDVEDGEFRAVYDLNDTDSFSMSRSEIYREVAIDIEAVRYWYPNGTMVTGSELDIDQGRSSTEVRLPEGNGTFAYTSNAGSKTFHLPAFVSGSYEVTLPEGHRSDNFLFGSVTPRGYDREVVDDREVLRWDDLSSTISIRFFLERDLLLFAGFVALAVVIGGSLLGYYYRQVKQLQARREEMGLDVDLEDDGDGGSPPFP